MLAVCSKTYLTSVYYSSVNINYTQPADTLDTKPAGSDDPCGCYPFSLESCPDSVKTCPDSLESPFLHSAGF